MDYNVVFLLRYWPVYGGGETVSIALANEMVKRNINVTIFYLWDNVRKEIPFIDPKIKTVRVVGADGKDTQIDDVLLSQSLNKYIHDEHVDFVINQWWLAEIAYQGVQGTDAVLIKCHHISVQGSWNIKVYDFMSLVKWMLGPLYVYISKKRQIRAIDKFYRLSDYVSFLAPSYMQEYISLTSEHIDKDRAVAIYNPSVYYTNLQMEAYEEKANIALFVGRMLESQKALKRLMNVWKIIERSGKCDDWILQMVGVGEDLDATMAYASSVGLAHISFEGFQQPDAYYKKSKVFMMTSKTEGLPMTLIEAKQNMLCPIVMDTFASLHDIITDGKDGIIVSESTEEMAKAFINLVNNPERLKRLAVSNEIAERFSVARIVDQWIELFEIATKK